MRRVSGLGLCLAVALATVACSKKEPARSAPKMAAKDKATKAAGDDTMAAKTPAAQEVPITSKVPEAIAAFKKGRDLIENQRAAEGVEELKKAVAADPGFALAHAMIGMATPGMEGQAELEKAASLADGVSPAEKTEIQLGLAMRKGETDKVAVLQQQLGDQAPGDPRVHEMLGGTAIDNRKLDEAIAHFKKGLELDPKRPQLYNRLAYAYAMQLKWDDAIAAAQKQVEMLPSEPNPLDTLAELQLQSGKFEEAQASFEKALSVSQSFAPAWQGVAISKAYRRDFAGADEAIGKALATAPRPADKLGFYEEAAWLKLAAGKPADAMKQIDAMEKEAQAAKLPAYAGAEVLRGWMSYLQDKAPDALKHARAGLDRAEKGEYPEAGKRGVRTDAAMVMLAADAKLGKAADADKDVATLDALAKLDPNPDMAQKRMAFAHGLAAMAKKDMKGAAAAMAGCDAEDLGCVYERFNALSKSGDAAGAEEVRKQVTSRYLRNAGAVWVVGKLAAPGGAAPAGKPAPAEKMDKTGGKPATPADKAAPADKAGAPK